MGWGDEIGRRAFWQRAMRYGVGAASLLLHAPSGLLAAEDVTTHYPWLQSLVDKEGVDRTWLNNLLQNVTIDSRVLSLMDKQAEALPYWEYRQRFITMNMVASATWKMQKHKELLLQIEREYVVPAPILVALWGVESHFGVNMGRFSILRTLFSLAVMDVRRGQFFQQEFREFMLLCREEGWDPRAIVGSYAGAMGQMQMMPSSMRRYGVDYDQDGRKDVFTEEPDVLASIAFYLQEHGWCPGLRMAWGVTGGQSDWVAKTLDQMRLFEQWQAMGIAAKPVEGAILPNVNSSLIAMEGEKGMDYYLVTNNFRVITRWNRSWRFAMVIHEFAGLLEQSGKWEDV